jgi:hypothetical protein
MVVIRSADVDYWAPIEVDGHVGLIRFDSSDRDQWQTNVAHLLKQAMQRGLVDDDAADRRSAVAAGPQGQPVEPGRPAVVKVTLEADLVPSGLVGERYCAHWCSFPLVYPG